MYNFLIRNLRIGEIIFLSNSMNIQYILKSQDTTKGNLLANLKVIRGRTSSHTFAHNIKKSEILTNKCQELSNQQTYLVLECMQKTTHFNFIFKLHILLSIHRYLNLYVLLTSSITTVCFNHTYSKTISSSKLLQKSSLS